MSGSDNTTLPATQTESSVEPSLISRTSLGQFVRGVSGNPAGRPQGSKNRSTLIRHAIEEALLRGVSDEFEEIMETAIRLAKSGDASMIRLLLGDLLKSARGGEGDENDPLRNAKTVNISIRQYLGNQEKPANADGALDGEFEHVEDSHDPTSRA